MKEQRFERIGLPHPTDDPQGSPGKLDKVGGSRDQRQESPSFSGRHMINAQADAEPYKQAYVECHRGTYYPEWRYEDDVEHHHSHHGRRK